MFSPIPRRDAASSLPPVMIDQVFRALADPKRRDVIERLNKGPCSVSELASAYSMALPSFVEHLKVLEAAGLVRSIKAGRVRTCHLEPERLRAVEDWLSRQRSLWEGRLDRLDAYLLAANKEKPE